MDIDFRNEWISKLGQRLGIPTLEFDSAGVCQLSLEGGLSVTIHKPDETENLVLFGELPVSHLAIETMQQMLIENRSHTKFSAPVLSLSENLNRLEIHFKLTQSEVEATEDIIDHLIGNLEYWQGVVQG